MEFAFYICGLIAILATLRVVTHTNPVHALLYLIISLLAIAGVFFSLGAYFEVLSNRLNDSDKRKTEEHA